MHVCYMLRPVFHHREKFLMEIRGLERAKDDMVVEQVGEVSVCVRWGLRNGLLLGGSGPDRPTASGYGEGGGGGGRFRLGPCTVGWRLCLAYLTYRLAA